MADQRGRDNPPIFYLPTQLAGYKYHALLTEAVGVPYELLTDLHEAHQTRKVVGDYSVVRPAGLYGFQTIDARQKFCNTLNAIADAVEVKICFPVTVPNIHMDQPMVTTIRYQADTTGPVDDDWFEQQLNKEL
jgi:hypothetical protein